MSEFSSSAQARIATDIARIYVSACVERAGQVVPTFAVVAALAIELGHYCRQSIESKKHTPEEVRRLLTLIEKIAFNPGGEKLQ